jgi:alanyl-tRNA synthetase
MGLERMAMVMQGVHSTYETDLFVPIINTVIGALGSDEAHYRAHFAAYRAIADHSRAIAFLIADGVLPGNVGRSYVLRRILRRAAYQGRTIGFERPFLAQAIATVIDQMGEHYGQLRERRDFILATADSEEQQFLRTLAGGITRLSAVIGQVRSTGSTVIPGGDAFVLKDTYGFPLDLTQKIAEAEGLTVDEVGYNAAMAEQRERSRAAAQFKRGAETELWAEQGLPATQFLGYSELSSSATVLALTANSDVVSSAEAGASVQIALDRTPFYAESGGQVGDTGTISGPHGSVRIEDTQRPVSGLTIHYGVVTDGTLSVGETVTATVDAERRADIQRNHTATHMLQRALRDVLGEHVAQAGSLVAPDRLRFDFTHTRAVTPNELRAIESRINAWVRTDAPVTWREMTYDDAIASGAIALFGEKYGDVVRVVSIGRGEQTTDHGRLTTDEQAREHSTVVGDRSSVVEFASRDSVELCGGTHVSRTGAIGYVRLVGESSVGSGLRRIEALTGRGAEQWVEQQVQALRDVAARLNVPPAQVADRIEQLLTDLKQRQQELEALRSEQARGSIAGLLDQVRQVGPAPVLAAQVAADDASRLREMGDWLRDKLGSGVIVLGAVIGDRPQLLAMVTPDMVQHGYHAGNLVKALAPIVGGGGGGRPEMAQAGGKDASKLPAALARVPELVESMQRV